MMCYVWNFKLVGFFPQHFKYLTPLSFFWHNFWREVICIFVLSYLRFTSGFLQDFFFTFHFLQFEHTMSRFLFFFIFAFVYFLSFLLFGVLWASGSMVWRLTLIWGNFQLLLFQILCSLSSLVDCLIAATTLFDIVPQSLDILFSFTVFIFITFQFWTFYWEILQLRDFFS